jgi:hypothetical protein
MRIAEIMQHYTELQTARMRLGSAKTSATVLQHLAQFGWFVVTRVWTWVGVPITIWGLLPFDVQQKLTGNYWPSSIGNTRVLFLGFTLLMFSCFRAWDSKQRFAEQSATSPRFELQINRIDVSPLPCGCELITHITIRNRGSDSQATDWQLRGSDNKDISFTSHEATQAKFEPMDGDLTDPSVRRSQTRRAVVTFIVKGISETQARHITYWFLACRDGLNVHHESAAQYL